MTSSSNFSGLHAAPITLIGLLPLVLIIASGCGSGNNDESSSGSGDMTPENDPAQMSDVRLDTRIIDRLNDGIDDQREVFKYNKAGRVILHTIDDLTTGTSQVIVFDYATDGRLLSKTDAQNTDSYTYEDDRLVAANRVANGMFDYQ